ncbi:L-fuculose-phosphate aldolase [Desulfacinum hydrothermale DSM 13146]|uniref:L-fuculose-phosphate aldolase n=1 Tax=Desulfacinum hydrothermale DSM 13146 TaxID=1121390 RepID=A0A1W1XCX8_9BACT|nr:class II aldolase/adducin family protein [Desulfacinum hydrothermale]SMC21664.1 L-fuculose-phosphate aldolase [Desulfacinum hydrothermale DSM 13146]
MHERSEGATEDTMRLEMIQVCRKLAREGLVAASDGNVSCRLDEAHFLITPSGRPKGDVEAEELLVVDSQGEARRGAGRPSSEIRMHLLVYQERPDVRAVVHAHPPLLTALTLAGVPFPADVFPEVWISVGPVPTAPYATPSTEEVPRAIAPFVKDHQAVLLERHGSLTVGENLSQAFYRLQKLEHAARCLLATRLFGAGLPEPLDAAQLGRLEKIFGSPIAH